MLFRSATRTVSALGLPNALTVLVALARIATVPSLACYLINRETIAADLEIASKPLLDSDAALRNFFVATATDQDHGEQHN